MFDFALYRDESCIRAGAEDVCESCCRKFKADKRFLKVSENHATCHASVIELMGSLQPEGARNSFRVTLALIKTSFGLGERY